MSISSSAHVSLCVCLCVYVDVNAPMGCNLSNRINTVRSQEVGLVQFGNTDIIEQGNSIQRQCWLTK